MTKTLKAALVAAALATALSSCTATVAQSDVEKQITSKLALNDGSHPDSASCPGDLDAKVGATMTCTATAGSDTADIKVTVTKVDGSDVNFDIEAVPSS